MKNKIISALLALTCIFTLCACGDAGAGGTGEPTPSQEEAVVLTIVGGHEEFAAIENAGRAFTAKYPNCTVNYEFLNDYYTTLINRMNGNNAVDLFLTTNIQDDNKNSGPLKNYALDLTAKNALDTSCCFGGLVENFKYRQDGVVVNRLYSVPLGAEVRGMYVNKTLLRKYNLDVPKNQQELLAACAVLKENGYIPFHGNPSNFGTLLLYPWICNNIANADNYEEAYNLVNNRSAGVSELFREPFEFLHTLVENDYYNYKAAQNDPTFGFFKQMNNEDYAKYFFDVNLEGQKVGDEGHIAFMPSTLSLNEIMQKTKEDYHSAIDYEFILSPVGETSGYAYLSPASGIAINKSSENIDWSVKFLNFLFEDVNSKAFASEYNVIPNTKDAPAYILEHYNVPNNHVSDVGQVTFGFGSFDTINITLVETSKANKPGNTLYSVDYYLNNLEGNLVG